ncbi:MAG: hypothetical protein FJ128_06070 [Deltaproteobacteria bacterium]|nr:hypothetical protein [Deltaproteobacteria bacterium]
MGDAQPAGAEGRGEGKIFSCLTGGSQTQGTVMFFFKKFLLAATGPVALGLLLLFAGLFLLWVTARQRAGRLLATAGALLLALAAYNPLVDLWLNPLERHHPILTDQQVAALGAGRRGPVPRWVVVLGGGLTEIPGAPATCQLSETTVARLVEGIRLHRLLPGSKLLFSLGETTTPLVFARLCESLGVAREALVLETQSRDTADQARRLAPFLGRDPFILVTSASHLPRSVALFRQEGLAPLPQAAGYLGQGRGPFGLGNIFPNAYGLIRSERALHEYLGLAWHQLGGRGARKGEGDAPPSPGSKESGKGYAAMAHR